MADMGHGAGMDMAAMAQDMRNRFLVALIFTIPIFFLAPMGLEALRVAPPFGWPLKPVLFVLASAAILYPGWTFFVAAVRETAAAFAFESCDVTVNAGDRPEVGEVYLTVTGTSAKAGDDGQVGRGNASMGSSPRSGR